MIRIITFRLRNHYVEIDPHTLKKSPQIEMIFLVYNSNKACYNNKLRFFASFLIRLNLQ